jgi:hypothetical protein
MANTSKCQSCGGVGNFEQVEKRGKGGEKKIQNKKVEHSIS